MPSSSWLISFLNLWRLPIPMACTFVFVHSHGLHFCLWWPFPQLTLLPLSIYAPLPIQLEEQPEQIHWQQILTSIIISCLSISATNCRQKYSTFSLVLQIINQLTNEDVSQVRIWLARFEWRNRQRHSSWHWSNITNFLSFFQWWLFHSSLIQQHRLDQVFFTAILLQRCSIEADFLHWYVDLQQIKDCPKNLIPFDAGTAVHLKLL